jgi:CHAT domain-containing protein
VGDSTTYAFIINQNRFEVKELPRIDSLEQKIKALPQLLKNKDKAGFSTLAYNLYQQLFEPLKINTPHLIIIPDGALWQLNFDLLLSQKPKKLDYRNFQYLIKDFTISYAYSAKLLKQDLRLQTTPTKNKCLAFSYNNPDDLSTGNYVAMRSFRNQNLGDLPGTRKEIKAVSSVVDGAYYYGTYANEKNFKAHAKDYSILHLALHGVIDNEDPMNSKLYFTQDKDTLEDNYLHAFELYNMELNADLAVLSACNTGSGKLAKGEGIMSLGRAFTYAGCKSLLLSQWEVSDAFTPTLMSSFYQHLNDGKPKAAALRAAKLEYLSKADNLTSNPYFWAPMVQLGDNRPLPKDNSWIYWLTSISTLVVLGITFWLINKRKTARRK